MTSDSMQIADFQNAVDAELRLFDETLGTGEVASFVRAIAGKQDPDEMDWIHGTADRGGAFTAQTGCAKVC